jgi:hypothetical protein
MLIEDTEISKPGGASEAHNAKATGKATHTIASLPNATDILWAV